LRAFAFAGVLPLSSPACVGGTARKRRQQEIDVLKPRTHWVVQWMASNRRIGRKRAESDLMFPVRSDPSWPRVTEKKDGRRPRSCAIDEQAEDPDLTCCCTLPSYLLARGGYRRLPSARVAGGGGGDETRRHHSRSPPASPHSSDFAVVVVSISSTQRPSFYLLRRLTAGHFTPRSTFQRAGKQRPRGSTDFETLHLHMR
jgi:hypothetical protein